MTSMRLALHLTENPDDTRLLGEQLVADGLPVTLLHVDGPKALITALADRPDLIVVDLPLPWPDANEVVADAQRQRPEIPVVFRWGRSGEWHVEDSTAQTGRAIRAALAGSPLRSQDEAARRGMLDQLVHQQDVLVRLARLDFWEFEASLRQVLQQAAELLQVERVSVWEFSEDRQRLVSLALYRRSLRTFTTGEQLSGHPRYLRTLEQSLALAAADAQRDPRTSEYAADYLIPLGISSMLDSPIRRSGKVAGVLCLEHTGPQRTWTLLEQCAAANIASLLARGLETRDRREVEDHLQRAHRAEALGRFASQLAHDFHNRLTVISLLTDLLRADAATPNAHEHLAQLDHELGQAKRQIRELLTLGRRAAMPPHPLELNDAVAAQAPMLAKLLGDEHELQLIRFAEPLWVDLEPGQLGEILTNLISNARDALAEQCSGVVTVRLSPAADDRRPAALLVVEDNGCGFTADAEQHVFEPFFTTKPPGQGSGMGLPSVHALAQQRGGTVRVKRLQPHGSRIEVVLPLLGQAVTTTARA
ncbi:MAG: GAF domain-containing protein [Planctomycetes bacterium]|nr:GAF domain-containing protein [Planctomycetota bacterium]